MLFCFSFHFFRVKLTNKNRVFFIFRINNKILIFYFFDEKINKVLCKFYLTVEFFSRNSVLMIIIK